MGRRRPVDMAKEHGPAGKPSPGGGRVTHKGLVVPRGVKQETGRALWQASCSCGWANARTNGGEASASRALGRHLQRSRYGDGGGVCDGGSS